MVDPPPPPVLEQAVANRSIAATKGHLKAISSILLSFVDVVGPRLEERMNNVARASGTATHNLPKHKKFVVGCVAF